jgi:MFS family permease
MAEAAQARERRRVIDPSVALEALRNRAFRWFILGRVAGAPTGQMRMVARGWLVYQMTGSALALGWVSAAQALMMVLLSPFGGVFADRFDKRHVMMAARTMLIVASLGMMALLVTGWLRPWHIAVVAMLEGASFSIMGPAQRTIVSELVEDESLFSALSVTAVFEGLMGVIGAGVAGWLIDWVGAAGVYAGMALLFAFVGYTLNRLPPTTTHVAPRSSVGSDLADGLRYLKASPILLAVLGITFARFIFVQPYREFRPAYAEEALAMGASGLGWLTSAASAGVLVASLAGASLGNTRRKGLMLVGVGVMVGLCLIGFVQLPVLPLPFVFVGLEAGFSTLGRVLTSSLLQTNCRAQFRARVVSLRSMIFGISRLATVPAGALVDALGIVPVVTALAALVMASHLVVGLLSPRLRRLN